MLKDLQVNCPKVTIIYCDNQGDIHISVNLVFHEITKHLEIDYHIVREKLLANNLKLLPVSSNKQVANFFTKTLLPQPFNNLLSKLRMIDIYHLPTCGGYYTKSKLRQRIKFNRVTCSTSQQYVVHLNVLQLAFVVQ